MEEFRKKKKYGQHFLRDKNIARKIAGSLLLEGKNYHKVIEIGPGDGSLTQLLLEHLKAEVYPIEIDTELIESLKQKFPAIAQNIINVDFLKLKLSDITSEQIGIIGNFPYNISSQILFKILGNRTQIPEMVGMFQKEVAERVVAMPGSKIYGSISVLIQTFYTTEFLFKVSKHVFSPPPKVESAVIRLSRRTDPHPGCDESMLFSVVKQAFNQRRKTLRNSLKSYQNNFEKIEGTILNKRPEQLSVQEFIDLTKQLQTLSDQDH